MSARRPTMPVVHFEDDGDEEEEEDTDNDV